MNRLKTVTLFVALYTGSIGVICYLNAVYQIGVTELGPLLTALFYVVMLSPSAGVAAALVASTSANLRRLRLAVGFAVVSAVLLELTFVTDHLGWLPNDVPTVARMNILLICTFVLTAAVTAPLRPSAGKPPAMPN